MWICLWRGSVHHFMGSSSETFGDHLFTTGALGRDNLHFLPTKLELGQVVLFNIVVPVPLGFRSTLYGNLYFFSVQSGSDYGECWTLRVTGMLALLPRGKLLQRFWFWKGDFNFRPA